MTKIYSLRAMALAGVCLAPLAAAAQSFDLDGTAAAPAASPAREYSGEVTVGARYQSGTSPLFGRYTGNDTKGIGSLGDFHVKGGDTPASGGTLFYEASGSNLNFQAGGLGPNDNLAPEAELNLSVGQQGTWKANAYYNAITYDGQNFLSPYNAGGGLAPGFLPFGGQTIAGYNGTTTSVVPAATVLAGLTTPTYAKGSINYYLHNPPTFFQETAGTRRDIGGADGKYINGAWTITTGLRHEHKEGTVLQTFDGSTAGIAFPEPVNYDTDRYNITGAFNTRQLQAQLGYVFSKFTDNNTFFVAPYITAATGDLATTQYSLPPSSEAHYINGNVGYNVTPTTRLNANFQYGLEMSDGVLGVGTATPQIIGNANLGKNESTTGELARVYIGNLVLTSRPLPGLDMKASYGIDGRDNDASQANFYGTSNGADTGAPSIQHVLQQNWTKQKATLEAGYNVLPKTKISAGYRFDDIDRSSGTIGSDPLANIAWVGHSTENTEWAKIADHTIANLNSALTYEHAVRTGLMELAPGSNNVTGGVVTAASAPFYEAPRTADRVKLRADYMASDEWSVGVNGKYEANHYNYPANVTGTNRDYNASAGPDVTYSPTKALALHAFYTYEEIYYNNQGNGCPSAGSTAGTSVSTGCTTNTSVASPANGYGWSASTADSVHTAGISADWKITDRLKIGTEYTFSYGDVAYNLFDGGLASSASNPVSYFNVQNLPSVNSSMHSVKVHGEYQLADNVTLLAGYGFDLFKDNDWAYGWNPIIASQAANTTAPSVNTFTSAESQPSYRIHSVYTSVRVKF
jgi:MtrB/PioB family decaheme-associated outer membrane protein